MTPILSAAFYKHVGVVIAWIDTKALLSQNMEKKKSSKQAKQFLPKILTLHFKATLNSFPCVPCVVHH